MTAKPCLNPTDLSRCSAREVLSWCVCVCVCVCACLFVQLRSFSSVSWLAPLSLALTIQFNFAWSLPQVVVAGKSATTCLSLLAVCAVHCRFQFVSHCRSKSLMVHFLCVRSISTSPPSSLHLAAKSLAPGSFDCSAQSKSGTIVSLHYVAFVVGSW